MLTKEYILSKYPKYSDITEIKKLNLWGEDIQDISIISKMPNLEILSLSSNKISSLSPISTCLNMREIYLRNNNIYSLEELHHLKPLFNLKALWLEGNPICDDIYYREKVLNILPQVIYLDNKNRLLKREKPNNNRKRMCSEEQKIRKNEFDLEKNKYNSICIIPKLNNNILNAERAWVHLSCALWNPDIEIKEINGNTNIKFIDDISYNKFMEKCDVCGKKGYGPTIKCNNDNCNFRCHPECGRINGYRLEIENKTKNGFLNFNMYCFIHQPVKLGKILEKFYKNKEQKIEEFANFLKRTYKNYEKEYQKKITDFIHPKIIKAS